jgi:hypothetical protein
MIFLDVCIRTIANGLWYSISKQASRMCTKLHIDDENNVSISNIDRQNEGKRNTDLCIHSLLFHMLPRNLFCVTLHATFNVIHEFRTCVAAPVEITSRFFQTLTEFVFPSCNHLWVISFPCAIHSSTSPPSLPPSFNVIRSRPWVNRLIFLHTFCCWRGSLVHGRGVTHLQMRADTSREDQWLRARIWYCRPYYITYALPNANWSFH